MGDLLHHGTACKDNLLIDDPELAIKELGMYKKVGGRTVVDVSSRGLVPRPLDLKRISEATGLNIIMGCGTTWRRPIRPTCRIGRSTRLQTR